MRNTIFAVTLTLLTITSKSSAANINDTYVPPKQLVCTITNHQLSCDGINNMYLKSGSFNGTIQESIPFIVLFTDANATKTYDNFILFYNYKTADNKRIQLNKTYSQIQPNLKNQNWIKSSFGDMYSCTTECAITNLPI